MCSGTSTERTLLLDLGNKKTFQTTTQPNESDQSRIGLGKGSTRTNAEGMETAPLLRCYAMVSLNVKVSRWLCRNAYLARLASQSKNVR